MPFGYQESFHVPLDRRANLYLHSAGGIEQIQVNGFSFSEGMLCREEWDQQLSLQSLVPMFVSVSAVLVQLISLSYEMLAHGEQA